jgi:cob(I)alamin adenosyltransferase
MRRVTGKKEMYTGKGDGGRTSLLGKQKVSKGSRRIDLLGELDEFTSALGLARAHSELEASRTILLAVQRDVYVLMAGLATTGKAEASATALDAERVKWLESQISRMTATVKTPDGFIVPGDTPAGAAMDLARTVARRVERRVVRQVDRGHKVNPIILSYLNRVSSLLFALELCELDAKTVKPTRARETNEKEVRK